MKSLFFILLFFCNINFVFSQNDQKTYPNNDPVGYYACIISALIFTHLNMLGVFYVFYWTFIYQRKVKSLSMSLKVPFYIACSNFLLLIDIFPQVYHLTIFREIWPGLACKVFGAFIYLFMLLNIVSVVAVSINTYIRICLKKNPDLGRYDWKLLLTVSILSLVIAATGIQKVGPDKFWCTSRPIQGGNAISTTVILVVALLISSFCYGCIIYKINSIDQKLLNGQRQIKIRAHVSKKIAGYILIFILQWIPTLPRYFYKIYSPDAPTWTFILIVISVNIGGIGNACLYHYQEAFKDIANSSSMEGSGTNNNSTP